MTSRWSESEDNLLRQMVAVHGQNWLSIAAHFPNRTPSQISTRWSKCVNPELSKGRFTPEEDARIREHVALNGIDNWKPIMQILPHRSSKQCKERWENHLNPNLNARPWTPEEDNFVYRQFKAVGPHWSMIARFLRGRTDVAVRNRFNSSIQKRIQKNDLGQEYLQPLIPRWQAPARRKRPSRVERPMTPSVPFVGRLQVSKAEPSEPPVGKPATREPGQVVGLFSPSTTEEDPFD
jgi:hypothetical protein